MDLRNEKADPSPYVYDWVGNSLGPDFRYGSTSCTLWYVPFPDVSTSVSHMILGWHGSFVENCSFPYGYAMWFAFLP